MINFNRQSSSKRSRFTPKSKVGAILWQFRWFLLLIAELALVVGVVKISKYRKETKASEEANRELAQAVTFTTPSPIYPVADEEKEEKKEKSDSTEDGSDAVSISEAQEKDINRFPFTVDFELLLSKNSDCVAWLYSEDTPINLAVLQGEDNSYYLFRTFDRVYNGYGTIFLDSRSSPKFKDANNLIFGHDMINQTMFGSLEHYADQSYFENHRYLWLATPEKNYRLDVVAGLMHSDDCTLYSTPISRGASDELIPYAINNSIFKSGAVYNPEANYVTLSTCSDSSQGPRLAIICEMVEIK